MVIKIKLLTVVLVAFFLASCSTLGRNSSGTSMESIARNAQDSIQISPKVDQVMSGIALVAMIGYALSKKDD